MNLTAKELRSKLIQPETCFMKILKEKVISVTSSYERIRIITILEIL